MSAAEPRHRGAAALVLDRDGRVLLVNWARPRGRWGLPGGRAEPEEEPHATAVREVREETGLVVEAERLLGVEVERLVGVYGFDDEDGTPHLPMDVLLCARRSGEAVVAAPRELSAVGWFDPRSLPEPLENVTPVAVADALAGRYGVVRLRLPLPVRAD